MTTNSTGSIGQTEIAEDYPLVPESLFSGSSRLCPTLTDVLSSHEALPYFIDFMEDASMLRFLHFWLDCEQFYRACTAGTQAVILPQNKTDYTSSSDLSESLTEARLSIMPERTQNSLSSAGSLLKHSRGCGDSATSVRPNGFLNVRMKPSPSMRKFNKDIQDNALRIFSQYLSLDSPDNVGMSSEMTSQILNNMCQEHDQVGVDCFRPAQDKVFEILSDKVFVDFLRSYQFLRYTSGFILSDRVSLADILNCTQTLEAFVEFVEEVGGIDFVRFILNAVQYQAQYLAAVQTGESNSRDWTQRDAMAIYDTYISMQAPRPVGLSDTLRISVEENICSSDGIPVDCFQAAVGAVYAHLSAVYLLRFFKSQPFMAYLVDLDNELKKAMIAAGVYSPPQVTDSKRRGKMRLRGRSASTMLLPAQDIPVCRAISSASVPSSESGRHRTESECDSRSSHSLEMSGMTLRLRKMAMGEVDALGRFVSYSEGEPPAEEEKKNILSRAVQKLNRSGDALRKKEQAALDAQRIIEDTLSQAMSSVSTHYG